MNKHFEQLDSIGNTFIIADDSSLDFKIIAFNIQSAASWAKKFHIFSLDWSEVKIANYINLSLMVNRKIVLHIQNFKSSFELIRHKYIVFDKSDRFKLTLSNGTFVEWRKFTNIAEPCIRVSIVNCNDYPFERCVIFWDNRKFELAPDNKRAKCLYHVDYDSTDTDIFPIDTNGCLCEAECRIEKCLYAYLLEKERDVATYYNMNSSNLQVPDLTNPTEGKFE